jgi:ElaB/YqjD/DUF883 family membrane-anchored ribosome-binding protein
MAQSSYSGRPSSGQAMDPISNAEYQGENTAPRVVNQPLGAGGGMRQVAANFKGALDKSIREQPRPTLAAAAIVGFVLGVLWKA